MLKRWRNKFWMWSFWQVSKLWSWLYIRKVEPQLRPLGGWPNQFYVFDGNEPMARQDPAFNRRDMN